MSDVSRLLARVDELSAALAEAQRERDAMSPVVEAARAYATAAKEIDEDEWGDEPYLTIGSDFFAAVDTYEKQTGDTDGGR